MHILYNYNEDTKSLQVALDSEGTPLAPTYLPFGKAGRTAQVGETFDVYTIDNYRGFNQDVVAFFAESKDQPHYGNFFSKEDLVTPALREPHIKFRETIDSFEYDVGDTAWAFFETLWQQVFKNTYLRVAQGKSPMANAHAKPVLNALGVLKESVELPSVPQVTIGYSSDTLTTTSVLVVVGGKYEALSVTITEGELIGPPVGLTYPVTRTDAYVNIRQLSNDDNTPVYIFDVNDNGVSVTPVMLIQGEK